MFELDQDGILAAFRQAQQNLVNSDMYSAGAKQSIQRITEHLIRLLKDDDHRPFWKAYKSYLNNEVDITCEILEEVFAQLNLQTIDPIVKVLS